MPFYTIKCISNSLFISGLSSSHLLDSSNPCDTCLLSALRVTPVFWVHFVWHLSSECTSCDTCHMSALRVTPVLWVHFVWHLSYECTSCDTCLMSALRVTPVLWVHFVWHLSYECTSCDTCLLSALRVTLALWVHFVWHGWVKLSSVLQYPLRNLSKVQRCGSLEFIGRPTITIEGHPRLSNYFQSFPIQEVPLSRHWSFVG